MDSLCEQQIMNSIKKLPKDTTTIIVAHRLSTIKDCDKVFVLDEGKIVENGKHKQLINQKGVYAKMWKSQNGVSKKI